MAQQQSLFSNANITQQQQVPPLTDIFSVPSNAQQQAMYQGNAFNPYINTNNNFNFSNSNAFNYNQMPIPSGPPAYGGYGGLFGQPPQQAPQDPAQLYNDDEPLI